MKQQTCVVLASEYPQTRSLLKEALEGEERTVIIGQAENARRALNLARALRPMWC
jgi:DNA-binding NarL/FixJ family response regulator